MEKKNPTFSWKLWLRWNWLIYLSLSVVVVLGSIGWIFIAEGLGYIYLPDDFVYLLPLLLSLLIGCLLAGLVQWFAFKGRIKYSYLWVCATALGWFLAVVSLFVYGFTPEEILPPVDFHSIGWNILAGATAGTVIGLLQWLVLWRQVRGAGWWILGSVLGWASVGYGLYLASYLARNLTIQQLNDWYSLMIYLIPVLGFLLMGMITGVAYAYLFSQPVQSAAY